MPSNSSRAASAGALGIAGLYLLVAGAAERNPHPQPLPEGQAAAYAVQVDGKLVAAWQAGLPRQPASLAKLALGLVVAGSSVDTGSGANGVLDEVVTVSRRSAAMPRARLGLRAGDRVRAGDLLRALIVASSNDACMALAEHGPDGVDGTVRRMNELAAALGMRATRFADPCGFDRPGQSTTAADLLLLANASLAHPAIAAAAAEQSITITTADGKRAYPARTSNALLARESGVVGLKTGITVQAGPSLIVAARQGRKTVTVVLLGAQDRWHGARRLLQHGFEYGSAAASTAPGS